MTHSPPQAFLIDLFSPDRPHPGHGLRVNAFGSRYYDIPTLTHGSLEDRAQLGKRMLGMDVLSLRVIGDDRVPWLHCWSGTDVFAAAYGSEVHRPENEMPFALPAVMTAAEADRLQEPDILQGPLGEVFALADRLVELCGPGYPVRICDIQSPLDIAALIWEKSAFFMALHEEPEAVHRLLRKVTNTLTVFARAFVARYPDVCLVHWPDIWMPPEWGICVSEDEIGSLSPGTFREFGMPYLLELAETFGGISLHSCAAGQHQWQNLASLPGIRFLNFKSSRHGPRGVDRAVQRPRGPRAGHIPRRFLRTGVRG